MTLEDPSDESVSEKIQTGALGAEYRAREATDVSKLEAQQVGLLSAQKRQYIEQLLSRNSSRLVRIPQVVVNNSQAYRDGFLQKQLAPLLADNATGLRVEDLLGRIDLVAKSLVTSTSTENLVVNVEALPKRPLQQGFLFGGGSNGNGSSNKGSFIDMVPVFHLLPVKRFFAKTGTTVGNGEGSGYVTFQLRNLLRGGENLSFDATIGTRTRTSYLLNLNFPINNNAFLRAENLFFMNSRNVESSSHTEILRGFSNKIVKYGLGSAYSAGHQRFYQNVAQEFSFENIWRTVAVLDAAASDHMLLQCGDDFKSSFVYNIKYDDRENRLLPKRGKLLKLQLEYAPSVLSSFQKSHFLKYSLESFFARPVTEKIFANFSFRTGIVQNLNKVKGQLNLMDKFYLGGPTDVRGFNYNGLGPRAVTSLDNKNYLLSGGDRLGGDFYYSTGLSVFTTIPRLAPTPDYNWKLHAFVNAGRLVNLAPDAQGRSHGVQELLNVAKQPSVSVGAGVLYNHPAARFELNVTVPVAAHESDALRKGVQYGIGLSFL